MDKVLKSFEMNFPLKNAPEVLSASVAAGARCLRQQMLQNGFIFLFVKILRCSINWMSKEFTNETGGGGGSVSSGKPDKSHCVALQENPTVCRIRTVQTVAAKSCCLGTKLEYENRRCLSRRRVVFHICVYV